MKENSTIIDVTFQVMEEVLQTDDVYEILSHSLSVTANLLHCDAAVVWIADKKEEYLHPLFHTGPTDITGVSVQIGSNAEGKCVFSGESYLTDAKARDYPGTVFDKPGFYTRSVMCVPIKVRSHTYGCFEFINKGDGMPFREDEQRLCERIAALAALSIDEQGIELDLQSPQNKLIVLKNVTKEFPSGEGTVQILRGIDLDIYENELIVILGESGGGKITLLNIIGGMDSLTSGSLEFGGKDFSHPDEKHLTNYRREEIGFIFQSYNLMPNLTVRENLDFIAELVPQPLDSGMALEKVGMLQRADYYPSQLSGGQQQRVAIARALVKNPKLILADEPTAALDLQTSLDVLDAIQGIVNEGRTSVVMVTHNVEIAKMANRVIRLRAGKISGIKNNPSPLHARELTW